MFKGTAEHYYTAKYALLSFEDKSSFDAKGPLTIDTEFVPFLHA